jgi:spermidine dehydrogenase
VQIGLPGFAGFSLNARRADNRLSASGVQSFPGGNDGIARFIVKGLIADAIAGDRSFDAVHNGRVRFDALNRRGAPTRLRLGATVVRVEHEALPTGDRTAAVTYLRNGRLERVRARGVVVATGAWAAKHAVRGLPDEYLRAFDSFPRSPMLVVNVALRNWRAMYRLGYTAASWRGGFGFCCNLRPNMLVGGYRPRLHPDSPNMLTFYVPFDKPGLPLAEQGQKGRAELLGTSYRDYERQIRRQLVTLFGEAGFDPARDIGGIVLNRWGHAYVNPGPGFYFGGGGQPAPRDVVRRPFGRIAFAHSELNGHQNYFAALTEGKRAAEQLANGS